MIAANIMTTEVRTLTVNDTLAEALKLLGDEKVRLIPVVDKERKILGVVTPRNLLRSILPPYITSGDLKDVSFAPELPEFVGVIEELDGKSVTEYYSNTFTTVSPETSTMEVATLFVNSEPPIESLLVTDEDGRLLGIIAPWDVFRRLCEYREK